MPRLKNRNHMVPHGFAFVWPATGWNARKLMPHRSFNDVVSALQQHVRGNPHQAQQTGMPTDTESLALRVEEQTVKELLRAGHTDFLQMEAEPPKWEPPQRPLPARPVPANAAGAKEIKTSVIAGVSTYLEWLGDGGQPVSTELATKRSSVCVTCPSNKKGDWKTFFTETAAAAIMKMIGMANDLNLKTVNDDKLGVCDICNCPLKAKQWAPIQHIRSNTTPETMEALPSFCWIKKE